MKYETPYMDIEILEKEDIVRTSTTDYDPDGDSGENLEDGEWG